MKPREIINNLEDDETLLNYKFDNVLIWPVIRVIVIQTIINTDNTLDKPSGTTSKNLLQLLKTALISIFLKNPVFASPARVAFFHTALSNIKIEGKGYNRVVDYFIDEIDDTPLVIEEPFNGAHIKRGRKKIYSGFFFTAFGRFLSYKPSFKKKQARELIKLVLEHVVSKGKLSPKSKDKVLSLAPVLVRLTLRIPEMYRFYSWFLKKKKCELIIIEDGYYGEDKAILIQAAKSLNIRIIEPQHGFVNINHPAYSFGQGVINNASLQKCYPDIFMSYGKFWSSSIALPNKILEIGNPHLTESLSKFVNNIKYKRLLVIGSGVTVNETLQLLIKLQPLATKLGYEVFYRPHPQEYDQTKARYSHALALGVKIDSQELYRSINEAEIIVGELTTVIFEAICFKATVKVYRTTYTNTYLTKNVKYLNFFDLNNLNTVFQPNSLNNEVQDYYWDLNWKYNFNLLLSKWNL